MSTEITTPITQTEYTKGMWNDFTFKSCSN